MGVDKETSLVIKDYTNLDVKKTRTLLEALSYDEILDEHNILSALAYEDISVKRKIPGWRILSKTLLPEPDIAKMIKHRGSLGEILHGNAKSFYEAIGEEKANLLKEEIEKIKLNPWQLN
jgi:DNA integrity scanning protein DisA with diadenylate cyclase activity